MTRDPYVRIEEAKKTIGLEAELRSILGRSLGGAIPESEVAIVICEYVLLNRLREELGA